MRRSVVTPDGPLDRTVEHAIIEVCCGRCGRRGPGRPPVMALVEYRRWGDGTTRPWRVSHQLRKRRPVPKQLTSEDENGQPGDEPDDYWVSQPNRGWRDFGEYVEVSNGIVWVNERSVRLSCRVCPHEQERNVEKLIKQARLAYRLGERFITV